MKDITAIRNDKYVDEGTRYIKAREFFKKNIEIQYKKWSDKITESVSKDAVDDLTENLKKL